MRFIEDGHIYIDPADGQGAYISVTTLLHYMEKPKDWDKIAAGYGKKVGKTKAEILQMWKEKKDKAAAQGTLYHKQKQDSLNRVGIVQRRNQTCQVKFHERKSAPEGATGYMVDQPDFKLEDNTVYTEFMVRDTEHRVCGTVDEIEVILGTLHINDHKTNEEIRKQAFSSPYTGREKLLPPVAHLDNCNWNIYCLQMSLYMHMLWKRNKHLKIGKLTLNHVQFEDGHPIKVIPMDVPYLRTEAKAILEWWDHKRNTL